MFINIHSRRLDKKGEYMEDNLNLKLQELRKKNNLSQAEVAEYLHVSRQAISQWENGKASPDIENIKKMCKLYGVSVGDILGLEQEEKPKKNLEEDIYAILEVLVIVVVLSLTSQIEILGIVFSVIMIIRAFVGKMKTKWIIVFVSVVALILSIRYTSQIFGYYRLIEHL